MGEFGEEDAGEAEGEGGEGDFWRGASRGGGDVVGWVGGEGR